MVRQKASRPATDKVNEPRVSAAEQDREATSRSAEFLQAISRAEKRRLAAERALAVERRAAKRAREAARPRPRPLTDAERRRLDVQHARAVREREARQTRGRRRLYRVWIEVVPRERFFPNPAAKKFWTILKVWFELDCIACNAQVPAAAVQTYVFARRRSQWDEDTTPLTLCPSCAGSVKDVRGCAEKFYQNFFDDEQPGKYLAVVEMVGSESQP